MKSEIEKRGPVSANLVLGATLIGLGIVFLLAQTLNMDFYRTWGWGQYIWPLFILVPGVLLFAFALAVGGNFGELLAVIGSITSMVGLILFYQTTTGRWESWAYAWALVFPTSFGLGQVAYGAIMGRANTVRAGTHLATIGMVIFLVAAAFFELILGIGGFGLGRFGLPVLLIGLGLLLLLRTFLPLRGQGPTSM